jgi:hypothetical protein
VKGIEREVATMLSEAESVDAEEDRRYGKARGDELPEEMRVRKTRIERLRERRERLEREAAEVTQEADDKRELAPMVERAAGVEEEVGAALADAGCWSEANVEAVAGRGAPSSSWRLRRTGRRAVP